MSAFHLTVASVGEIKFEGEADSATFPGVAGEFTVLAHHEPLVSTLRAGTMLVRDTKGGKHVFEISTGVVEVSHNHAIVLM